MTYMTILQRSKKFIFSQSGPFLIFYYYFQTNNSVVCI